MKKILEIEIEVPEDFVPPEKVDDGSSSPEGKSACDPCPFFRWNDNGGYGWCALLGDQPTTEVCPIIKEN